MPHEYLRYAIYFDDVTLPPFSAHMPAADALPLIPPPMPSRRHSPCRAAACLPRFSLSCLRFDDAAADAYVSFTRCFRHYAAAD